jgi:hypothetical protein
MTPAAAPTVTMGIDLAAQARDTAVCLLAWPHAAPPELLMLGRGASAEGVAFDDGWLAGTATGRRREHPAGDAMGSAGTRAVSMRPIVRRGSLGSTVHLHPPQHRSELLIGTGGRG